MNYDIIVSRENPLPIKYYQNVKFKKIYNSEDKEIILEERTLENYLKLKSVLGKRNIKIDIVRGLYEQDQLAIQDFLVEDNSEYLTG